MCEFDRLAQTVSVGLVDDGQRLIVGTGGQAGKSGQPNCIYELNIQPMDQPASQWGCHNVQSLSLSLAGPSNQLVRGMPTDYGPFGDVDDSPVASMAPPTETKTRQVLPFSMRSYGYGESCHRRRYMSWLP